MDENEGSLRDECARCEGKRKCKCKCECKVQVVGWGAGEREGGRREGRRFEWTGDDVAWSVRPLGR